MNIGLTYDLRDAYLAEGFGEEETAEFDRGQTIDEIEAALRQLGHRIDRVGHIRQLVPQLAAGKRWDLVFNIAEGLSGFGREAQIPGLLDAYEIPYTFADPLTATLTLHKGMAKRVLQSHGIATTPFAEAGGPRDLERIRLPYPLFVKPIAEGTAKGIDGRSKVDDRAALETACRRIWDEFRQPALIEPFLPGREFTVAITGTGDDAVAVGTMEIELLDKAEPHSYTYVNKEQCEELCRFPMATPEWRVKAEPLSLAAWRALGCRDAGRVDLRADARGELQVMELNPLPGLHPWHSDLPMICTAMNIAYVELINRIVTSASRRIVPRRERRPVAV